MNISYLKNLFGPLAFIPLFSPALIIMNPLLLFNLISDWPYMHSIEYHYTSGLIGTLFIALIYSALFISGKLKRAGVKESYVLGAISSILLCSILLSNGTDQYFFRFKNVFSSEPVPTKEFLDDIYYVKNRLGDSSVSVNYLILNFFSGRQYVYRWPNPFKRHRYGAGPEVRIDRSPDYVVLFNFLITEDDLSLLKAKGYMRVDTLYSLTVFGKRLSLTAESIGSEI